MDIFAHFLWTYALYFRTKKRLLAGFFGIMPDLAAFGFFFIYNILTGGAHTGRPTLNSIPKYVFVGYNFTHSLVIFFIIVLTIYYITREIPIVLGGWLLHILIDIPTHSRDFFPTPFLWPLSDFTVNGVGWGETQFMIINYSLLVILYLYLFIKFKKKKKEIKN